MYQNMNLCDVIILYSLTFIRVSARINAQFDEVSTNIGIEENYIKSINVSRNKRSLSSKLCYYSIKLPCAINSNYVLVIKIGEGGCGSVYKVDFVKE